MKRNVYWDGLRSLAIVVSVSVLAALLLALVAGCSRDTWHVPLALPNDSTSARLGLPPARKYKFSGPVTFTVATAPGAVATTTSTDNRKAGQRGGAAATAPDAVATTTTKKAAVPWWALVLVALAGAVLLAWLQSKFAFLSIFKR